MKKANDNLYNSRMDFRRRQRIVEIGGIGPMTQERIKCPFCSELILRDALKCRFCGEWFSMAAEGMAAAGPIGDSYPVGNGRQRHSVAIEDIQERFEPTEGIQRNDNEFSDTDQGHVGEQDKRGEAVEQPPVRVAREVIPGEGLDAGLRIRKRRRRIPWLRALLLISYLGIAAVLVVSESDARGILRDARAEEDAQEYDAAFSTYRGVLEVFPFSFAVIEARQSLRRICESPEFEMPKPSWLSRVEDLLGTDVNVQDVYLLPLAAWPVSALLLLLVLLTRIWRPVAALLALLLMIVAIAGSVAQLAWYGRVPLAPVAQAVQGFMQAPAAVYCASYVLLALTALMTLTARRAKDEV